MISRRYAGEIGNEQLGPIPDRDGAKAGAEANYYIAAEILHRFTLSRDRQIPALRDEICPQAGSLDGDLAIPFEHKLMGNFCRDVLHCHDDVEAGADREEESGVI
jgi:hypothetical protein